MATIDWVQAKKDYLEDGTMSYQKIANKYGVSKKTVENHASVEGWANLRQTLGEVSIQQAEGEIVNRNAEINTKHQKQYADMQVLAVNIIRIASNTMAKAAREKGLENLSVYEKDFIKPGSLVNLYNALKIAMDGERVTVGLPTSVERKEFTGKDGTDLFAKADPDKIYTLLSGAMDEIERHAKNDSGS